MDADEILMYGPSHPVDLSNLRSDGEQTDMNAMTDLVGVLKDIDATPEKIEKNKDTGIGSVSGDIIKLEAKKPKQGRE